MLSEEAPPTSTSRKWDPDWRHHSHHGATARFLPRYLGTRYVDPRKELAGTGDCPYVAGATATGVLPEHVAVNLNKHKRWETVPEYLEEIAQDRCDAPDLTAYFRASLKERRFTLQASLPEEPSPTVDVVKIFYRRGGLGYPRPSQVTVLPPDSTALACKLSSPSVISQPVICGDRICHRSPVVKRALVANDNYWDCWVPEKTDRTGDYLQVDLGEECIISHIGTRGRYANTVMWPGERPHRFGTSDTATYRQQLEQWQNNTRWLMHRYGREQCEVWDKDEELECVKRYELSFRSDSGDWVKLPTIFSGNTDWHTESVHALHQFAPSGVNGLAARYANPIEINDSRLSA